MQREQRGRPACEWFFFFCGQDTRWTQPTMPLLSCKPNRMGGIEGRSTRHRWAHSYSCRKADGKVRTFAHRHATASGATRIRRAGETHLLVGHRVIPPEKSCSDVVSHHHIHSVVVVSKEDAEHPDHAERPAKPVIPPESPRGIWKEAQTGVISEHKSYQRAGLSL